MVDAPPTGHAPPGRPLHAARSSPLVIPADHPAYAGHFPGNPVLPGVVLLDAAVSAIAAADASAAGTQPNSFPACEIVSAKFHEVVRPGDELSLEHETLANNTVRFTIRTAQQPVASGILKRLPGGSPSE